MAQSPYELSYWWDVKHKLTHLTVSFISVVPEVFEWLQKIKIHQIRGLLIKCKYLNLISTNNQVDRNDSWKNSQ